MSLLRVFEFFAQNTLFRANHQVFVAFYHKSDEKLELGIYAQNIPK